jgi:hypothetical protein
MKQAILCDLHTAGGGQEYETELCDYVTPHWAHTKPRDSVSPHLLQLTEV